AAGNPGIGAAGPGAVCCQRRRCAMSPTTTSTLAVAVLAVLQSVCLAQPDAAGPAPAPYAGHRLVQARIETLAQMERMLEISGDCWSCHPRAGVIPFRVAPERMAELRASGIEFEVVIEDLQAVVDAERERIRAAR